MPDPKYRQSFGPRYYAVQILPQFSKLAQFHLSRQGFDPFFPRLRIRHSQTQETILPLFKGYCFVRFDPDEALWRSINGTRGVISLVPKFSERPKPLIRGFVEALIEKDPVTQTDFDEALGIFYPGVQIRYVREGHLYDKRADVIKERGKLLEICFHFESGQSSTILVHKEDVETIAQNGD